MRSGSPRVAMIPAVLLALAACSNGATTAGPTTTTTTTTTTGTTATSAPSELTSAPPAGATRVEVSENEYTIVLPRKDFSPGAYTFVVANQGKAPHDLWIKGPGVDNAKTQRLNGGDRGEVTVTLQPGTYELWCSIGNHRARGMAQTVTVSG